MNAKPKAVLAFSGGLDTTYCAVWLREQGYEVHTVTVQTDSAADEITTIEQRARSLGVAEHRTIDARPELFDDYLRYLIFANALRGEVYPLSVSAERIVQAKRCALYAVSRTPGGGPCWGPRGAPPGGPRPPPRPGTTRSGSMWLSGCLRRS